MVASIKLYQNTNFQGQSVSFQSDTNPKVPNLKDYDFNDKTSSLVVSGPGTWILYQNTNYGGDKWTVTASGGVDGSGVYKNSDAWNGKNDSISSLEYIPNTTT